MDLNELFDLSVDKVGDGCYDVTLRVRNGLKAVVCDNGYDEVTLKLREVIFPKIGSRVTVDGRLVKVKNIVIDSNGNIFIVTDTDEKVRWA